jgi:hypothetical protein
MRQELAVIYQNLEWIYDKMDDLHERINDYIFYSGCDIDPDKADVKILRNFDKECNELNARYNLEVKEIEKYIGNS